MFPVKDSMSIERLGYQDLVSMFPIRITGGMDMSTLLWLALCGADLLRQIFVYNRGAMARPGLRDETYHALSEELVALTARPSADFRHGALHVKWYWAALSDLVTRASKAFPVTNASDHRTVFVSGDALTKGNDFAAGGLFGHLADRDVRCIVEPMTDLLEFFAWDHERLIFGRGSARASNFLTKHSMILSRRRLYALARREQPWLPVPALGEALRRAEPWLGRETNGTATLAIGNALHHWANYPVDGVVLTGCWGCSNGLVGESLLRYQQDIPFYFHYDDGTPLDERKLDSYAFRLHRSERRVLP
jgi:hypothetical protein